MIDARAAALLSIMPSHGALRVVLALVILLLVTACRATAHAPRQRSDRGGFYP